MPSALATLDVLLQASRFDDTWSDDTVGVAAQQVGHLSEGEWKKLAALVPERTKTWKLSLAQALDAHPSPHAVRMLHLLMSDPDEDVFYEAAVSLESLLDLGLEVGQLASEFQSLISGMQRRTGKALLGLWSLESRLNQLAAQRGSP